MTLYLKNYVNVASKSHKQTNVEKKRFVVIDENSRIWSQI
jgi:hypothetical protein